jgi:DnaJ-class molecular chaperone
MIDEHEYNLECYLKGKYVIFKNSILKKCTVCDGDGRQEINTFLALSIPCEGCAGKGHEKIENEITNILYGE